MRCEAWLADGAKPRPFGVLVKSDDVFAAAAALAEGGVGPVTVTHPAFVFEPASAAVEALAAMLAR